MTRLEDEQVTHGGKGRGADPGGEMLQRGYCSVCRIDIFPLRARCPRCDRPPQVTAVGPIGRLYSYTEVHLNRSDRPGPYTLGLVDFPDGLRVLGEIDGAATALRRGLPLELTGSSPGNVSFGAVSNGHPAPLDVPVDIPSRPDITCAPLGPREVAIIGVGVTRFSKDPNKRLADLGREAVREAIGDAAVNPGRIEAAWFGSVYGGMLIGQRVLRDMGLSGIPTTNVENACSSGATALREAAMAVSHGQVEMALAVGLEQMSHLGAGGIPLDAEDWEVQQGLILPAMYAMRARAYLDETGCTEDVLADVVVKSREHAVANPNAQFRSRVTAEEVMDSRSIADPLTLLQCSPKGDGAAAVVLVPAAGLRRRRVRLRASALFSGVVDLGPRDLLRDEITERTVRAAYEQAGIGPTDLDVCELHDAFSIAEILYYEALGLAGRGLGPSLLRERRTSVGGDIPVNPGGGLLSRGHPLGATGVVQIAELVIQLRGQAGVRQVEGATVGLAHCTGGGIAGMDHGTCAVHILTA